MTGSYASAAYALLRLQGGEKAEKIIAELDERFLRNHGHAKPHAHDRQPVRV